MPPEESKATDSNKSFDAELRKDLRKQLVMSLPMLMIGIIASRLSREFNNPESSLPIIVPAIAVMSLILMRSTTRQKLKLGWPGLIFVSLYILTFYLASAHSVLDWKSTLVESKDEVPYHSLALNRLGDWHYEAATENPALPNLVIVFMNPVEELPDGRPDPRGRLDIADLLTIAQDAGAKGVAIDSYFVASSNKKTENEEGIDDFLCDAVKGAQNKGLKVFVGYDSKLDNGIATFVPIDPALGECLPEPQQGHVIGYADRDGIVRSIPLYLNREYEALSLKVANSLSSTTNLPGNKVLQFTKPKNDFLTVTFDELKKPDANRNILNRRFVMVGDKSPRDSFETPFGNKSGVEIHAYAVQSMLEGRFIRRPTLPLDLFLIAIWCYLLIVLTARSVGNQKLILINIAASLGMVGIAALAMRWLIWIDPVYAVLAAWILLSLLIALRRIGLIKSRARAG